MAPSFYGRVAVLAVLLVSSLLVVAMVSHLEGPKRYDHPLPIWKEQTDSKTVGFQFSGPPPPKTRFHKSETTAWQYVSIGHKKFNRMDRTPFYHGINGTDPSKGPYDFLVARPDMSFLWKYEIVLQTIQYIKIGPFRFNSTVRFDTYISPPLAPEFPEEAKAYVGSKWPKDLVYY